jgi:uncharacterized damage-inducible protein DinB
MTTPTPPAPLLTREHEDLLQALAQHRTFLRVTAAGLTDAQAASTPTASELSIGGLIKHVAASETAWIDFILTGPAAVAFEPGEEHVEARRNEFRMIGGETLADVLDHYAAVERRTDAVVAAIVDLDASQPLPEAPWFEPGARWSARRALLHVIAETAQHAGHADVIRETIDGQKTMG